MKTSNNIGRTSTKESFKLQSRWHRHHWRKNETEIRFIIIASRLTSILGVG